MNRMTIVAATLLMAITSTANAQFDLGKVIRNEFRQSAQQIQGQVQGHIRGVIEQGIQPGITYPPVHQPLPVYPPPQIIYPTPEKICPVPPNNGVIITPHPTPVITPTPPKTPVQPQPEPAPLPVVQAGQTVSIDGEGFGETTGTVFVRIGETILGTKVVQWTDTVVDVQLPDLPLVESVDCIIAVVDAQKQIVEKLDVTLTPREEETVNQEGVTEEVDEDGAEPLPQVEMGSQLELAGESMGVLAGKVELKLGELTLQSTVVSWSDTEATVQLPAMELTQPADGLVRIIQADGELNSEIAVQFISADTATPETEK